MSDRPDGDLSGEKLEDIDEKFISFFSNLHSENMDLEDQRKMFLSQLAEEIEKVRQKIRPELLAIANEYEPKLKSVVRDLERLKLDFDGAWDKLYEEYPHYRSRELTFDAKNQVFRFGNKARPYAFLEFLVKPLQEELGPLGEFLDPKSFMENEDGPLDFDSDQLDE